MSVKQMLLRICVTIFFCVYKAHATTSSSTASCQEPYPFGVASDSFDEAMNTFSAVDFEAHDQDIPLPWWHAHDRNIFIKSYCSLLKYRILIAKESYNVHNMPPNYLDLIRKRRSVTAPSPPSDTCEANKVRNFTTCYKKNHESSLTGTVKVCSYCDSITDMGSNCSPRYVNEKVCRKVTSTVVNNMVEVKPDVAQAASGADTCFSGEGTCRQIVSIQQVRRKLPDLTTVSETFEAAVSCECQLYRTSVLVGLNED